MTNSPRYAEHGEVILGTDANGDYVHLPLMERQGYGINMSVLGVYPPKQIIGDFTRDSHQLLSSYIQSSFIGGGQIGTSQEATDQERFWYATLETRYPRALTLAPLTATVSGPNTSGARPLGDYGTATLASYGAVLRLVESGTASGGANLTATPVNKGTQFAGTSTSRFFIPLGASGIDVWDGAAVTNIAGVTAQSLTVFDQKLYAVQTNGQIKYSLDGTAWTDTGLKVDATHTPRHIVTFYDRQDNPCLHVITDTDVWAIDASAPNIYRTELQYPRHPYQGLAATVWRTDLYVSVGTGLHRYTGSVITSAGVDRDEGLPRAFAGYYVDLTSGYNGLYALIKGLDQSGGESSEEQTLDLGDGGDGWYVPASTGGASVMVWDGMGWHTLWTATDVTSSGITSIYVSGGGTNQYRLWWGCAGDLYYQDLPLIYQNPKQLPTGSYATTGYLETPWLDMSMTGTSKILASIEIDTLNCSSTNYIDVSYGLDSDGSMTYLGRITSNGHARFQFGSSGSLPDGDTTRYRGASFERIKLRFEFARNAAVSTSSPLMESFAVVYLKKMGKLKAWEFVVDLDRIPDTGYKGRGRQEIIDFLEDIVDDTEFVPFCPGSRWYNVKVSGVSGLDVTGVASSGSRRVNVVEAMEM